MSDDGVLDDLPIEILQRCVPFIMDGIAAASPDMRGSLMRAMSGDSGVITARAHKVGATAFVFIFAELDNGYSTSMELPGDAVGVFVVDGDLVAVC